MATPLVCERPAPSSTLIPRRLDLLCAAPLALVVAGSMCGLAARMLTGHDFWWDEAGQYWMAQGQMHLSPAGAAPQALGTGLDFGRNGFNLDPIGFTVLLRGWIEVWGSSPALLRALPFIIYLLSYLAAATFGGWLRLPWVVNLSWPFVVLGTQLPVRFSVELRAFSFELLAVLVTGAITVVTVSRRTAAWCGMLALSFVGFGIATRYSYVVAIIGSLVVLATMSLLLRDKRLAKWSTLPAAAAAFTTLVLAWNIGFFGGGRQASPSYTDALELAGSWTPEFLATTVRENLATGAHLMTGAFLAVGLSLSVRALVQGRWRAQATSSWFPVFLFALCYEVVSAGLSAAGLAPWNAAWRWSIGLSAIALLSGFGLARIASDWLLHLQTSGRGSDRRIVLVGVVAVCWIATLSTALRLPSLERTNLQPVEEAIGTIHQQAGTTSVDWLVAADQWPTFRMLVETKALRDGLRPRSYSMLGSADSDGGTSPVFFTSDRLIADDLPPTVTCDLTTSTAVLVPFASDGFPATLEGVRRLGTTLGCRVAVIDLGSGGSAVLLRKAAQ